MTLFAMQNRHTLYYRTPTFSSSGHYDVKAKTEPLIEGLTQQERLFARYGTTERNTYVQEMLEGHVGTGESGLSMTPMTLMLGQYLFPHHLIAARDKQGKPYGFLLVSQDPTQPRPVVQGLGLEQHVKLYNRPQAKQALVGMMKLMETLGTNWIVAEPSSPEARRFLLRYLRKEGRVRPCTQVFYEGKFDKAGIWTPEKTCV